jgi:hypothetical protein
LPQDSTQHNTEQLQQVIMRQSFSQFIQIQSQLSVVGGEELSPPQFGTVQISIKPKNGTYVSDFDKQNILNKLSNILLPESIRRLLILKFFMLKLILPFTTIHHKSRMLMI